MSDGQEELCRLDAIFKESYLDVTQVKSFRSTYLDFLQRKIDTSNLSQLSKKYTVQRK